MKKILVGLLAGATLFAITACLLPAGSGEGLTDQGVDTVGWGAKGPPAPADTNLTFVVNNVFKVRCTGCHGSNPIGDALTLTTVTGARTTLFNSDSTPRLSFEEPGIQPRFRVLPNFPDSSYLYQKVVSSTPKSGVRMPEGGQLTADQIKIIRRWIEKGAPLQ